MKMLIAIASHVGGAASHQSVRDTYLQWLPLFPEVEHRFFVGDGMPTGEDESHLCDGDDLWDQRARRTAQPVGLIAYNPGADEVILKNVPDDYLHCSYKTREQCRWALERDFSHIFLCMPDTYIDVPRLMASGFENHEYNGYWGHCDYVNPAAGCAYSAGGRGLCISRKAASIIANASVTHWSNDLWIGKTLFESGILLFEDIRYNDFPRAPLKENTYITSHLFGDMIEKYNSQRMYEVHASRQRSYENGTE